MGSRVNIDYTVLRDIYGKELKELLKELALFVLEYRPHRIDLLLGQRKKQVTLLKKEVFYLVVLMFLGLVPEQIYDKTKSLSHRFQDKNSFSYILTYCEFKTRCIVEYLKKGIKEVQFRDTAR